MSGSTQQEMTIQGAEKQPMSVDYSGRYDTFVAKSEFHNFRIRFADNTLLGHDNPDLKIVGAVIKYELCQRGQNGDAFARKWCLDNGVIINRF